MTDTQTVALALLYLVVLDAWPDYETCEDCDDIEGRPCIAHENVGFFRALRAAEDILGPCRCGHNADTHHDEDNRSCKICACGGFSIHERLRQLVSPGETRGKTEPTP